MILKTILSSILNLAVNLKLPNCLIHGAADVSDEWDRQDGSSVAEEKKRTEGGGGALAVT